MTIRRYHRTMRESEIEKAIIDGANGLGGYAWHIRDSRSQNVQGMPDLLIVAPPVVALIEAKSQYREITDTQAHVQELLTRCTDIVSGIVRPVPKEGELSLDEALHLIGVEVSAR